MVGERVYCPSVISKNLCATASPPSRARMSLRLETAALCPPPAAQDDGKSGSPARRAEARRSEHSFSFQSRLQGPYAPLSGGIEPAWRAPLRSPRNKSNFQPGTDVHRLLYQRSELPSIARPGRTAATCSIRPLQHRAPYGKRRRSFRRREWGGPAAGSLPAPRRWPVTPASAIARQVHPANVPVPPAVNSSAVSSRS